MLDANGGAIRSGVGASRYTAPSLTIYGSVVKLTAGGSKPGNEAGIICPGNNPGNIRGTDSNCHT